MKKKTATVLLCAGLAICLSGYFCAQVKADDAFIVEEEVFIGGESLQEEGQVALPVQMPEVPPPAVHEPTARQEQLKPVEESGTQKEMAPVSQNSISQNHLAPVFRVPVRRNEAEVSAREEEKSLQSPESEEKEVQLPEEVHTSEPEIPSSPAEHDPWWMIAAGGIFFLGGCARLVWRVRGRK